MSVQLNALLGGRAGAEEEGHSGCSLKGYISFSSSSLGVLLPGDQEIHSFPLPDPSTMTSCLKASQLLTKTVVKVNLSPLNCGYLLSIVSQWQKSDYRFWYQRSRIIAIVLFNHVVHKSLKVVMRRNSEGFGNFNWKGSIRCCKPSLMGDSAVQLTRMLM